MPRSKRLLSLMETELPRVSEQKRLLYRTTVDEVKYYYNVINEDIFRGKLIIPDILVTPRCRGYWGICQAKYLLPDLKNRHLSNCSIKLMDKWFCQQWLITTLAHEMCHQYQWDIEGPKRMRMGLEPIMSHGPSFFRHREKLANHGIPLRRAHRMRHWLMHQNLFKC